MGLAPLLNVAVALVGKHPALPPILQRHLTGKTMKTSGGISDETWESMSDVHGQVTAALLASRMPPPVSKNPSSALYRFWHLADVLTQSRQQFGALLKGTLRGHLAVAGLFHCRDWCFDHSVTWQSLYYKATTQTSGRIFRLLPAGLMSGLTRQRGAGGGRRWAGRHGGQGSGGRRVLGLLQLSPSVELLADAGL